MQRNNVGRILRRSLALSMAMGCLCMLHTQSAFAAAEESTTDVFLRNLNKDAQGNYLQSQPLPVEPENLTKDPEGRVIGDAVVDKTELQNAKEPVTGKGKKKTKKAVAQAPAAVMYADKVHMEEKTGNVRATGAVKVAYGDEVLHTEQLDGNYKTSDVWLHEGGRYINRLTKTDMVTVGGAYNYKDKTGNFRQVSGKSDLEYIKAREIFVYPDRMQAYDGMVTRCNAKSPDYHLTGKRIDIFPNDKMVIYDMKVYFHNKLVYAQDKYIRVYDEESLFPSIGYSKKDGIEFKKRFKYAFNGNVEAFVDLRYYTLRGFRSYGGLAYDDKNIRSELVYGYVKDSDNNWVKKEPELNFKYKARPIGKSHINYYLLAAHGKWSDDVKSSWHTDVGVYFYRDPIYLSKDKTWSLNLATSYRWIMESFDKSSVNSLSYNATIGKRFNDRFSMYTGYYRSTAVSNLFQFGSEVLPKEWRTGLAWQVTKRDVLKVTHRYDMRLKNSYDWDISWHHNMHCAYIELRYQKYNNSFGINWNIIGF